MALFMDKALARRIERTEAAINASFIEARIRLAGAAGAPANEIAWRDFGGTYAMFDGLGSPMTQTFGLGIFEPAGDGAIAQIEAFYRARRSPVFHEVSPLAGIETFALLAERGYRPVELSTVLAQPIDGSLAPPPIPASLVVRPAAPHEASLWTEVSVAGWAATEPGLAEHIRDIATVAFENPAIASFIVEKDGRPIATGALGTHEGVALMGGASTIPDARGHGAQKALLTARLLEARRRGCDVAMMAAEPGSISQRNAERNGFRVAYTRVKWKLEQEANQA